MSKTITVKKAKDALRNLSKLTPANPKLDDDLEVVIKEAVFFMAPDLVQMTRRGFTIKELSKGLADEGVDIKPGTLNRYLNEYLTAQGGLVKPETGHTKFGSRRQSGSSGRKANKGPGNLKTGSENPKSTSGNPQPGDKTAGEESNPRPDNQSRPSAVDKG